MNRQINNVPFSQRQLRVGELIKQSLGQIFLRDEAKLPSLETKNITVTEVRMSPDLKNARAYVIPLGGKDIEKVVFPLLYNLMKSDEPYIHWPNRKPIIRGQIEKILKITREQ